jgi:hypothetical protein
LEVWKQYSEGYEYIFSEEKRKWDNIMLGQNFMTDTYIDKSSSCLVLCILYIPTNFDEPEAGATLILFLDSVGRHLGSE